jgi:TatA/E family protein of Tat protein translocase
MPFSGFHFWELVPLVLLALLIFGPKKLPELGSSIGKTIREFQKSMREVTANREETPASPPQVTSNSLPLLSAPTASSTVDSVAQALTSEQPPV